MEGPEENKEKVIKDLEETRDLNQKSIEGIKKAVEDVPHLIDANRVIAKEIEAIKQIPPEHFVRFPEPTTRLIELGKFNAQYYYGKVNQIPYGATGTSSSTVYTTSTSVYNWMDNERNQNSINGFDNALVILKAAMDDKQIRDNKKSEIKTILGRLLNPDENKYEIIMVETEKVKADVSKIDGLAFAMRTFLEKIKGALKLRLPNQTGIKDNKILPTIAEQLLDPTKSTPPYNTYMLLTGQYHQL